jgi:hypothetical protein
MPSDAPPEALAAYGTSTTVATCATGQAFEIERTGWSYDRIKAAIEAAAPEIERLQAMCE